MFGNRLLFFISGFLKGKAILGPNREPYLERYMLARFGQHAFFLHRFLASDPDHGLHDHPWDMSKSLIICGGYQEKRLINVNGEIVEQVFEKRAGDINHISGDDFHQIILKPKTCAWTIFYHGPRTKGWGFALSDTKASECPRAFKKVGYEVVHDSESLSPWERSAPRGRHLNGRSPESYYKREQA